MCQWLLTPRRTATDGCSTDLRRAGEGAERGLRGVGRRAALGEDTAEGPGREGGAWRREARGEGLRHVLPHCSRGWLWRRGAVGERAGFVVTMGWRSRGMVRVMYLAAGIGFGWMMRNMNPEK